MRPGDYRLRAQIGYTRLWDMDVTVGEKTVLDLTQDNAVSPRRGQEQVLSPGRRRRPVVYWGVCAACSWCWSCWRSSSGLVVWGVGINNQLVRLDQGVNETWAQVQNVYQRRADLIPNLVETVKGFAAQERTVLDRGDARRARAATGIQLTPEALNDPKAMERFQAAQSQLSGALSRLLVDRRAVSRAEEQPELPGAADRSSRAPRTGSRSSAGASTRPCATTTRASGCSPAASSRAWPGFTPKAFFEAAPDAATPPKVKF